VQLKDTWENLLVAITNPPTALNLQSLQKPDESGDYAMEFGANYGSEAGVDVGLPPGR